MFGGRGALMIWKLWRRGELRGAAGVALGAARGAVGGAVATGAMTLFMLGAQRLAEGGRLGPKAITQEMIERTVGDAPEPVVNAATAVNHLAYGVTMGALYGATAGRSQRLPPAIRGILFGNAIWALSYKGWVPAMGILPEPEHDITQRQLRVYLAHWVYGGVLGAVAG